MSSVVENKACTSCATAKRRCGKQRPHCVRCRRRGIDCTYPPAKPTNFVLCGGSEIVLAQQGDLPHTDSQLATYCAGVQTPGADGANLWEGIDLPGFSCDLGGQLGPDWYIAPETWKVQHVSVTKVNVNFGAKELKSHIMKILRWLAQWVEKGNNPFIHSRLYRTRFPRCIQDAYMALSSYLCRKPSNETIVFRIIEDRAKQLVEDHGLPYISSLTNMGSIPTTLDSLQHLARVQALLVYQIISLYDGDIRLRHLAETHIPVLNSWMQQMLEHAKQDVCLGGAIFLSAGDQANMNFGASDIAHWDNLPWYSWILAESIRRTWVVASGIQGLYAIAQRDGPTSCQGGMMFTACRGVWEAPSAPAWGKMCSERNPGLIQMAEADKLFAESAPEDVNDFAMIFLEATFGSEKMERWGVPVLD